MAIDNCKYSFAQLASEIFPRYMEKLRRGFEQPAPMADFAVKGEGVATLLPQLKLDSDFSGCYVLIGAGNPVYVGISRTVLQKLRQHVLGTSHFNATLAYRIASRWKPHETTRDVAMADKEFLAKFEEARDYIRGLGVAFVKIKNPVELYAFEAFCAMELNTS